MWKRKSAAATCQAALANFTIHSKIFILCDLKKICTQIINTNIRANIYTSFQEIIECFANSTHFIYRYVGVARTGTSIGGIE